MTTVQTTKPTVVIHTNDRQMVAALVCAHSLKTRSKNPELFDVRLLRLEETPQLYKRHNQPFLWWPEQTVPSIFRRHDLQSFAPLRRMVPEMLGFKGRALVLDPDVFAIGDVFELLSRDMCGKAILCRQKNEFRAGRQLYSSAVMLLDCAQLAHWDWEREIVEIFAMRMGLGWWLALLDESPDRIGLFEDEWNDMDRLTEKTKLLHTTELRTQPWKTGLPVDYHEHAQPHGWMKTLKRLGRRMRGREDSILRYEPHPDPRQEQVFFLLLRECLEQGSVSEQFVRRAMRKNYLRKDAFEMVAALPRP